MARETAGLINPKSQRLFLALIVFQMAHSIEEYIFELYNVFAPARFVSGLVSNDLATGFAILNTTLVAFGLWCAFVPVRRNWSMARTLAVGWAVVEVLNGTTHILLAVGVGGYFPGVATAPLILVPGLLLWGSTRGL